MALTHAGATGVEPMSVSGHSSLALVQENIDAVEQERAADAAMDKSGTSSGEHSGSSG